MSLENSEVVDAIGLEKASDTIVLSIVDSWDWNDERGHLMALQEKLNAYFGFVESGQIYESYPDANSKALRIDVVGRYTIPAAGISFLEKASATASELGMAVTHKLHAD
ncbi:DUF6572 domain-containing protein [Undibacterium sp. SXout7W]|uniref:DUF6572 domain-containing protein n=1 Tax=Undibacterium sp. SXout7W TaxID=3413049 RepID=UPI003BF0CE10